MRPALPLLAAAMTLASTAFGRTPGLEVSAMATPAATSSLGASFTTAPDGTVWMTWVEHHGIANTLRTAALRADDRWDQVQIVATDPTLAASHADFPQTAFDGSGNQYALWTDGRGGAFLVRREAGSDTWSAKQAWTAGRHEVEQFSLTRLAGGEVLSLWLDGRARTNGAGGQQLFARIVGQPETSDALVDGSVCDCCQTTLTPFLDGGALAAYRGRTTGEVRDVLTARFRRGSGGTWDGQRPLNHDDWRIAACPVNGPRLASDGSRVAAAWFTAATNEPQVLVSYSPDAGSRWLMPLRVDRGHPLGHVDVALLKDSAIAVTWLETDGSLWLRRITPEFTPTEPLQIAPAGQAASRGFPRLALQQDYAGGRSAARLVVAYTGGNAVEPVVRVAAVTIREGELLTTERNCDCAPTAEQLQGFALRGVVVDADPGSNVVRVRHEEVPGVYPAGSHAFRVTPETLASIRTGREFLGRIDRRDATWWLFDLRYLGDAATRATR